MIFEVRKFPTFKAVVLEFERRLSGNESSHQASHGNILWLLKNDSSWIQRSVKTLEFLNKQLQSLKSWWNSDISGRRDWILRAPQCLSDQNGLLSNVAVFSRNMCVFEVEFLEQNRWSGAHYGYARKSASIGLTISKVLMSWRYNICVCRQPELELDMIVATPCTNLVAQLSGTAAEEFFLLNQFKRDPTRFEFTEREQKYWDELKRVHGVTKPGGMVFKGLEKVLFCQRFIFPMSFQFIVVIGL